MRSNLLPMIVIAAMLLPAAVFGAEPPALAASQAKAAGSNTVVEALPGLASGALTHARIADLPAGQLVKAGELVISDKQLTDEIAGARESLQVQLKKNAFFLAEQMAARQLLSREAKAANPAGKAEELEQVDSYLESISAKVSVSDEEIAAFYAKNKDMFDGADLAAAKTFVKNIVLEHKQQDAVETHIRTLGQRVIIEVSATWAKEQAVLARDNVVDKARLSDKPSVVDFGSKGCRPCDMLAPILDTLRTKYEGKANVVFVSVREEQILAARYGIQSIPVQIFFDKQGKEVFRHVGFYPQEAIEKQMAELGVK